MVSGAAATRSGSMIGSRGTPVPRKLTPSTRMSSSTMSVGPSPLNIVVFAVIVTGAENPGASKVIVSDPVEINVRISAVWFTARA